MSSTSESIDLDSESNPPSGRSTNSVTLTCVVVDQKSVTVAVTLDDAEATVVKLLDGVGLRSVTLEKVKHVFPLKLKVERRR
jgi:hypothetical protein